MQRAVRLLLERRAVPGSQLVERRELDLPIVVPPGAGHLAVDEERRIRGRHLVWNTSGRYASGSTWVRLAWTRRIASQVGRNRTGASVSGSGSSPSSTSSELGAVLGAEPPQLQGWRRRPAAARCSSPGTPRRRDRRRPEGREVALDAAGSATASRHRAIRTDDVVGQAAQVGAPPLPGARRRNAQDREVGVRSSSARPDARRASSATSAGRFIGPPARSARTRASAADGSRFAGALVARPAHSCCVRATAPRHRPVVGPRATVWIVPRIGCPGRPTHLRRRGSGRPVEAVEARPEADVRVRGVLVLDAGQPPRAPPGCQARRVRGAAAARAARGSAHARSGAAAPATRRGGST